MKSAALKLAASLVSAFALVGCSSFSILKPASNATASSPVATDLFWNADLQAGTLSIAVDASDVTGQFSVSSFSANSHATANLSLPPGAHTLSVTGGLWDSTSQSYKARSASEAFVVANSPGRPVTYTETIFNVTPGWPAGQLGNVSFGGSDPQATNRNVNLVLTFDGNTNDVVPYFVPRPCAPNCTNHAVNDGVGFEIVAGTATITVQDAISGNVVVRATFLPAAGIFVSVDNGNGGIGFGCKGALPNDPTFPDHGVEVAYPYALFSAPTTDLTSNYTMQSIWALSTPGFNGSPNLFGTDGACLAAIPLATTAGVLQIKSNCQQNVDGTIQGTFTTLVH